jgi:hypothetical protein
MAAHTSPKGLLAVAGIERAFDTGEVVIPAELRQVAERAAPVTLAREQTLPVLEALQPLLPDTGLARGSVVGVRGGAGATSLALALAAGASQAGSWTVVVGLPAVGLAAAAEAGVALERLALVAVPPHDPSAWAPALAALVGAVDVVVVDGRAPLRAGDVRRLTARARERGSVLVPVRADRSLGGTGAGGGRPARAGGSGASGNGRRDPLLGEWTTDLTLTAGRSVWEGLGEGHGHLRRRRLVVVADGRGRASRPRQAELWLPAEGGGVAATTPLAPVGPGDRTDVGPSRERRRLRPVPDPAGWDGEQVS